LSAIIANDDLVKFARTISGRPYIFSFVLCPWGNFAKLVAGNTQGVVKTWNTMHLVT
jgi:glutamate-1-semialdehyde aminotransferase